MTKICFISEDALVPISYGQHRGGSIFLYYVTKHSDSFVINPYLRNRPKIDEVNNSKIYRVFWFKRSFIGKIINGFIFFVRGFFIIKKERPDLILACTTTCYLPSYLISKILGIRCKMHLASAVEHSKLKAMLMKFRYDEIITIGIHLKKQISPFARAPIRIVPNGVDLDLFVPQDKRYCREKLGFWSDKFLILYVGAFEKVKRLKFMMEVFNEFYKKHSNSRLLLIGKGKEEKRLKILVKKMQIDEKVKFKEAVPHSELGLYYNAADVLLLCSESEGGSPPRVVLEAMACNRPAITIKQADHKKLKELGILVAKTKEEYLSKLEQVFRGQHPLDLRKNVTGFNTKREVREIIKL